MCPFKSEATAKGAAESRCRTVLPRQRELFYGGDWHKPLAARDYRSVNPARPGNGCCSALALQAGKAARSAGSAPSMSLASAPAAGTRSSPVGFGGYKQSGLGREDCLARLLACRRIKNVNLNFAV